MNNLHPDLGVWKMRKVSRYTYEGVNRKGIHSSGQFHKQTPAEFVEEKYDRRWRKLSVYDESGEVVGEINFEGRGQGKKADRSWWGKSPLPTIVRITDNSVLTDALLWSSLHINPRRVSPFLIGDPTINRGSSAGDVALPVGAIPTCDVGDLLLLFWGAEIDGAPTMMDEEGWTTVTELHELEYGDYHENIVFAKVAESGDTGGRNAYVWLDDVTHNWSAIIVAVKYDGDFVPGDFDAASLFGTGPNYGDQEAQQLTGITTFNNGLILRSGRAMDSDGVYEGFEQRRPLEPESLTLLGKSTGYNGVYFVWDDGDGSTETIDITLDEHSPWSSTITAIPATNVGSPTVAPGLVDIAPTAISSTSSIGSPAVGSIALTAISSTSSIGSPTVGLS